MATEVKTPVTANVEERSVSQSPGEKRADSLSASAADGETPLVHHTTRQTLATWRLSLLMIVLYLASFLIAMDRTIVATATPTMTNEFNSLADVAWYAAAYNLPQCAFALFWGKFTAHYSPKWIFIGNVFLFAIGSIIAGFAPSSPILIFGRALSGVGSAGVNAGVIVILSLITPGTSRPLCTGLLGVCFGLAAVIGPVLGGALTSHATWRWVFWINVPLSAIIIAVVGILLHMPSAMSVRAPFKQQFWEMDPIGSLLFLPSIVSLLLALTWGGAVYAWNDPRIIALLVVFGVLGIGFSVEQFRRGKHATLPPRIVGQRSVAAGFWFSFCTGGSLMVIIYFLSLYFTAIKQATALQSGVDTLPLLGALVLGSIAVRVGIVGVGYYAPFMLLSALFMSIGAGLITTLDRDAGLGPWIGFQILYGLGVGLGLQQSTMAGLTVLSLDDYAIGMSILFCAQALGGAVFVTIGQNVFASHLLAALARIPAIDPPKVLKMGATSLQASVDPLILPSVLEAYASALRSVFIVVTIASALSAIGAMAIEWRSVKNKPQHGFEGAVA